MRKRSVLVVDDDEDVADTLRLILGRYGWDVDVVGDGRSALEKLKEGASPQLMLIDLVMPGLDGAQLVCALRADERLSAIPVVVLSGAGDVSEKAAGVGAAGWLRKPFELRELVEMTNRLAAPAS